MPDTDDTAVTSYPFRSWVRSTCRTATLWGVGVVAILGAVSWFFQEPGNRPVGRAFGVLAFYATLFLVTLVKIWWTASRSPAVRLGADTLSYQTLHGFRPKSFALDEIVSCGLRSGTESLRFVRVAPSGRPIEFFLNLAVIDGRNEFLHRLGRKLEERGLEPAPEPPKRWIKPGHVETFWGVQS